MCPCNKLVTGEDYENLAEKMPERRWKQILTECLGVPEELCNHANKKFPAVYDKIVDSMNLWTKSSTHGCAAFFLTRLELYKKLVKAHELGMCDSTEWFSFLVLPNCVAKGGCMFVQPKYLSHSCLKCDAQVTEGELSKISRHMPPQMWRHICTECLGVSDADLDRA